MANSLAWVSAGGTTVSGLRYDNAADSLTRTVSFDNTTLISVICAAKISVDRDAVSTAFSVDGNDYVILGTDTDGTTMLCYAGNGYSPSSASLTSMSVGSWYIFAFTKNWDGFNNTVIPYYATAGSSTLTQGTTMTTGGVLAFDTLWWGKDKFSESLNGCTAMHKIWTGRVLTKTQLETEMVKISVVDSTNIYYWNDANAGDGNDMSGQGHNFTENGTVVTETGPGISY